MMQDKCWICGVEASSEDRFCRHCGTQLVSSEPTRAPPKGSASVASRTFIGVFLTVVGSIVGFFSYLAGIIPMLALGLGSILIGAMVLFLPEGHTNQAANAFPSLLILEKLLEDLDLDERGIYIPSDGSSAPKVFVPLAITRATAKPPLGLNLSRRIFVTVGKDPEDRGILLDAPGGELLMELEKALGSDMRKIPPDSLETSLDAGLKALGIASQTTFQMSASTMTIELQLRRIDKTETSLRNLAPHLATQIGTPTASMLASAVSKATGKYVTIKAALLDEHQRRLRISLNLYS